LLLTASDQHGQAEQRVCGHYQYQQPYLEKQMNSIDEKILLADGFEDAFVGVARQFNKCVAVYDHKKCIKILIDRDGMTPDEAEEYFEFNVIGSYVGELTPCFLTYIKFNQTNNK